MPRDSDSTMMKASSIGNPWYMYLVTLVIAVIFYKLALKL